MKDLSEYQDILSAKIDHFLKIKNRAVGRLFEFLTDKEIDLDIAAEIPPDLKEPMKAAIRTAVPGCQQPFAENRKKYGLVSGTALYVSGIPDGSCVANEVGRDERLLPLLTPQDRPPFLGTQKKRE